MKISTTRRIINLTTSESFFWGIVTLLVLQASWIALTGRYPMAFDENFHFGIIQLYAHHISPFWSKQPPMSGAYGAVARDPSYLYQYLMSFPYRLISLFTHDQTIQVLVLRAINIALLVSSLPLLRRLLQKTGASRGLVHCCLMIFILIPVMPLLAAQINYDNLVIPLVALSLLLTLQISEKLDRRKPLKLGLIGILINICLLTSLVKYEFLPIFIVIIVFLGLRFRQIYRTYQAFWGSLKPSMLALSKRSLVVGLVITVLSLGLFVQRYGVNLVLYHNPTPSCDQVLPISQCQYYGPWERDYNYRQIKLSTHAKEPKTLPFFADWFYGMWLRSFFAVDGPSTDFETRGPLPIPSLFAIGFGVVGLVAILLAGRRVLRRYNQTTLWFFVAVTLTYTAALFVDEYLSYLKTGATVAINGRYLFPVLPLILVWIAMALQELLKRRLNLRLGLLIVAFLSLIWGGGALTYILRSSSAWYWPASEVYKVNNDIQNTIGRLVPGYNDPDEFL